MQNRYLVVLSYVDPVELVARTIHFSVWSDSAQSARQAAREGSRSPSWIAKTIERNGGSIDDGDDLPEIDQILVVPLEQAIDEPAGIRALAPERAKRLGIQVTEYAVNAVIASLRVGGPESIEDILDLGEINEAIEMDPCVSQSRFAIYGIGEALDVRWPEVLDLMPEREIDWRSFSPEELASINADRAKRGLAPLVAQSVAYVPFPPVFPPATS